MNDGAAAMPVPARPAVVRPRDAASLILLRRTGRGIEVLVGRRSMRSRFMPGVYVFPGGAIDAPDRVAWSVETGGDTLAPRLARAARAALRETWEEVGVLVGCPAPPAKATAMAMTPVEQAYRQRGLAAAFDQLTYVGRAITPSHSSRRFNTRFFLGDGDAAFGEPVAGDELEDVGWHPIADEPPEAFRDVTRFMLTRALELFTGTADGEAPLFYWAKNARRIGICREALAAWK